MKAPVICALLAALLLAGFFRLKGLTFQSLWLDELVNLYRSAPALSPGEIFSFCRDVEHNPPFFYILTWLWQKIWGVGEYSARLLPALIGVAGVAAVFGLGCRIFSRKAGLIAAFITVFLPFHIRYSQEVRPYALLFLVTVCSYLFLVRLLDNPSWKNTIFYFFFTGLMLYTHYYGILVLVAQIFFLIIYFLTYSGPARAPLLKRTLLSLFLIVFSYLPWIPTLNRQLRLDSFWPDPPQPDFFLNFFKRYFGQEPYLTSVFTLLIILYLIGSAKKDRFPENKLLIASWVFIVLFIPYLRSFNHPPIVIPRYSIAILPGIILMASRGLLMFRDLKLRYFLLGTVILMFLINLFYTGGNYYSRVKKEQWRQTVEYIIKRDPGARYPVCGFECFGYYFNDIFHSPRSILPRIQTLQQAQSCLEKVRKGEIPGFWVLEAHQYEFADDSIHKFLDNNLDNLDSIRLKGAKATLYGRETDSTRDEQR